MTQSEMKTVSTVGFAVVAVIAASLLMSSFTVVEPGHRGVRVTMGKVAPEALAEGVAFKWPLGVSRIEEVNVQQQKVEADAPCFSSDLQTVKLRYAVMYRLNPSQVVTLYQDYKGDPYESLVSPRVQEALKQVTAKYTAEALVQKREIVREETREMIRRAIGQQIEVVDFNVINIDLSDQLEQAIEGKMVQQQAALKKEFELNSERKEAEIVAVKAEAEAKAVKIRGEAIAANPAVMQFEIVKKWNGISPTVVVLGQDNAGSGAQVILPIVPSPAPSPASNVRTTGEQSSR
jgi:prohibitin 2